jgi:hypothetical protein
MIFLHVAVVILGVPVNELLGNAVTSWDELQFPGARHHVLESKPGRGQAHGLGKRERSGILMENLFRAFARGHALEDHRRPLVQNLEKAPYTRRVNDAWGIRTSHTLAGKRSSA